MTDSQIRKTKVGLVFCISLLGLFLVVSSSWSQTTETVLLPFSYVILASDADGSTIGLARTVVPTSTKCSQVGLSVKGQAQSIQMTPRQGSPISEFSDAFPVTVCEGKVQLGDTVMMEPGIQISIPRTTPARIVLFGDTGCKTKDQPGCLPSQWPFQSIVKHASSDDPDLVIHLGDYNYRGTPRHVIDSKGNKKPVYDGCTTNKTIHSQNNSQSNGNLGALQGDNWTQWQLDFFVPAQPLLQSIPWVVLRGNHELCSRAGPGWFYFLDPSSNLTGSQLVCPKDEVLLGSPPPPYSLTLDHLQVVVMDSANACDKVALKVPTYETAIQTTVALAGKDAWFLTHRPMWSVLKGEEPANPSSQPTLTNPEPKTATLSRAADSLYAKNQFPSSIPLVLSGHMHEFESLTFNLAQSSRSPMLILGNGGVFPTSSPLPSQFSSTIYGTPVIGSSTKAHGYLFINHLKDAGTWAGTLKDWGGTPMGNCSLPISSGKPLCSLNAQ